MTTAADFAAWESIPRSIGPWWPHPSEPRQLWHGDRDVLIASDADPDNPDYDLENMPFDCLSGGDFDRAEDVEAIAVAVNDYGPALERLVAAEAGNARLESEKRALAEYLMEAGFENARLRSIVNATAALHVEHQGACRECWNDFPCSTASGIAAAVPALRTGEPT